MIPYQATLQVGRIRFNIAAENERTLFERVSLFAEMPERCGNPQCGETALQPRHRSPQGNDYYSLDCVACGWRYTYGITKEDKRLFPHRKWEPPFSGSSSNDEPPRTETGRHRTSHAYSHGSLP
jgi:rubredoxin